MKINQSLTAALVAGNALIWSALPAFAGLESFTQTYGSPSAPLGAGPPNFPASLAFPAFDTSLGNLTGVKIILDATMNLQADVINSGTTSTTFMDAEATGTITAAGPDGTTATATLATPALSGSIPPLTIIIGPIQTLTDVATVSVPTADLAAYEGPIGQTVMVDEVAKYSGIGISSQLFFSGNGSGYGSVEIQYDYTTNSVPDDWNVFPEMGLCCGSCLLGFVRNRRATL